MLPDPPQHRPSYGCAAMAGIALLILISPWPMLLYWFITRIHP